MHARIASRSLALAATAVLAVSTVAFADTVSGDADTVTAGAQASLDLGQVGPGAVLHVPIDFWLKCKGFSHVDPGQTVRMTLSSTSVPSGGSVSATDGEIGPVPPTWADDTAGSTACPSPAPSPITASTLSEATIVAPMTPGGPYTYSLLFDRTLSPAGTNDSTALTSLTAVTFTLTVLADTPPVLQLPADETVEGDATGGWIGTWSATATDAEDGSLSPVCSPADGSLLPLGTTEVDCSATDSGGMTATGSFRVTVVDTTPPQLVGVPSDVRGVTSGTGVAVTYDAPTATDVVDPQPTVSCSPASGSTFPVGTTDVTCTATDASGNRASETFPVTVARVAVVFGTPIGADGSIVVRSDRTLPVKLTILRDGAIDRTGPVSLHLVQLGACPAAATAAKSHGTSRPHGRTAVAQSVVPMRLDSTGDRWSVELDLSGWDLAPGGCYRVDVLDAGVVAGSFTLVVI